MGSPASCLLEWVFFTLELSFQEELASPDVLRSLTLGLFDCKDGPCADHFLQLFSLHTCSTLLAVCIHLFRLLLHNISHRDVLSHIWLLRPHGLWPTRLLFHGIFQARLLEWGAISYSRDLSDWGIKPTSPALAGRFLTTRTPWKAPRLLQSTGSGLMGFSSWSTQGSVVEARRLYNTSSVVVVLRLRCFAARGISPDQGSNLCVSALKGGFLTTRSPGKPNLCCVKSLNFMCVFFFYGSCWKLTH